MKPKLTMLGLISIFAIIPLAGCLEPEPPPAGKPLSCEGWLSDREILIFHSARAYETTEEDSPIYLWLDRWGNQPSQTESAPTHSIDWNDSSDWQQIPLIHDLFCALDIRLDSKALFEGPLFVLAAKSEADHVMDLLAAEQARQGGSCDSPCFVSYRGSHYHLSKGGPTPFGADLRKGPVPCDWPHELPMTFHYASFVNQNQEGFNAVFFKAVHWDDEDSQNPPGKILDWAEPPPGYWPEIVGDVVCYAHYNLQTNPGGIGSQDVLAPEQRAERLMVLLDGWAGPGDAECCFLLFEAEYFRLSYSRIHVTWD